MNNPPNTYDVDIAFRNSDPITVKYQRFNLDTWYEILNPRLSIYCSKGWGLIIDKIYGCMD